MSPPVPTEFSSSDSENEAPEAISLSQTKKASKKRENALREHQLAEREKQRAKNRERDRLLKDQALRSKKRKGEALDGDDEEERNDVEARMLRAMQQAEDEGEGEDGESSEQDENEEMEEIQNVQDGDSDGEGSDNEDGEDEEEQDMQDDDEMNEDDSESESEAIPPRPSNRLPDHVFMAAATSSSHKKSVPTKDTMDSSQKISRRRKKSSKHPKEAVIGGRTIKALASANGFPTSSSSMVPSAKIRKFIDRSLSLKGSKSKSRGWERRPVNIGSMRRQGPAANFVRNS